MNGRDASAPIGCLVVDDHAAVRAGIRLILEREPGLSVVGEAASGEAAVELARRRRPDVVVMDIQMGDGIDGFEATRRLLASGDDAAVVLFTGFGERTALADGLSCGARGYLVKDAEPAEVVRAVRTVAAGGAYVDAALGGQLMAGRSTLALTGLTSREREVLVLLADGLTTAELAARLFLSVETIRTHLRTAMRKLDADTRTQAVAVAIRQRLIG
jgi:DNA-binding NarL/FixJ family response regulator